MSSQDSELNRGRLAEEETTNAAVRARVEDYLARTGLKPDDFARRIGYGGSTVRLFLRGKYESVAGTARRLVTAADAFIAAHPVAKAARVVGDLYDTENVRTIRDTFEKLLPKPVAYMIYAPPGSQKSFVLEHEVARLNQAEIADPNGRRAFYVYARQNIRPRDLIRRVAVACGCRVGIGVDSMLDNLRFDFQQTRALLVVDEAQHLSIEAFEILRELLDRPPYFSLLFAGSHDLKKKFDEFSATLEQWNSRIIAKVRLPGLHAHEAHAIIMREVGHLLSSRTPEQIKRLSEGLIQNATVRDAFEKNRHYINVRTLTNALDQIKSGAADGQKAQAIQ